MQEPYSSSSWGQAAGGAKPLHLHPIWCILLLLQLLCQDCNDSLTFVPGKVLSASCTWLTSSSQPLYEVGIIIITEKNTASDRLSNLPKVTQLARDRDGTKTLFYLAPTHLVTILYLSLQVRLGVQLWKNHKVKELTSSSLWHT